MTYAVSGIGPEFDQKSQSFSYVHRKDKLHNVFNFKINKDWLMDQIKL